MSENGTPKGREKGREEEGSKGKERKGKEGRRERRGRACEKHLNGKAIYQRRQMTL